MRGLQGVGRDMSPNILHRIVLAYQSTSTHLSDTMALTNGTGMVENHSTLMYGYP
jgi:hypothetical protein